MTAHINLASIENVVQFLHVTNIGDVPLCVTGGLPLGSGRRANPRLAARISSRRLIMDKPSLRVDGAKVCAHS